MRLLKLVPDNTNLPFVSLRTWAFALTLLLSIAAVGLVFAKGLNLGVDFVGGLTIEEKFSTPPSIEKLRTTVDALKLGDARLQAIGADGRTVSIKLPPPKSTDEGAVARVVQAVQVAVTRDFPDARFSKQDAVSGKVVGRADPERHPRRRARGARHRPVRDLPLRMAIRRVDRRRDRPRRVDDARLLRADAVRIRPQHRRRRAHNHRLFDQRQDRDRRPHPREYAALSQDGHAGHRRSVGQRDAAAHGDDVA